MAYSINAIDNNLKNPQSKFCLVFHLDTKDKQMGDFQDYFNNQNNKLAPMNPEYYTGVVTKVAEYIENQGGTFKGSFGRVSTWQLETESKCIPERDTFKVSSIPNELIDQLVKEGFEKTYIGHMIVAANPKEGGYKEGIRTGTWTSVEFKKDEVEILLSGAIYFKKNELEKFVCKNTPQVEAAVKMDVSKDKESREVFEKFCTICNKFYENHYKDDEDLNLPEITGDDPVAILKTAAEKLAKEALAAEKKEKLKEEKANKKAQSNKKAASKLEDPDKKDADKAAEEVATPLN
jgi:hypothetical protein